MQPQLVQRSAQSYVAIPQSLPRESIGAAVPSLYAEIYAWLAQVGCPPAGPPLIRYLDVDPRGGMVRVDVGVPVLASALPAHGRIRAGVLPAGIYVTLLHAGIHASLVATTAMLLDWGRANRAGWGEGGAWSGRVEHYLVGPPDEMDPASWRTEVAILLAEDAGDAGGS